jgi:hypothetical protein
MHRLSLVRRPRIPPVIGGKRGDNVMAKVLTCEGGGFMIHCPACGCGHKFDGRWEFNGDVDKPTFKPSMLVGGGQQHGRCHSYVTDGKIEFLSDSKHELAGQTVDLPDWDKDIFEAEVIECTECVKNGSCGKVTDACFGCINGERKAE